MAAPTRMLANDPHNATCESQFNICWISSPPGIPADVGDTLTCARTTPKRPITPPPPPAEGPDSHPESSLI
jgi:hypothetical protein